MFRKSVFLEIALYTIVLIIFMLGMSLQYPWEIGWIALFVSSSVLLIRYLLQIKQRVYVFHKLLFVLGILLFIIWDPTLALLQSKGFPSVYYYLTDDYIPNKVGVIVSIYLVAFYLGVMCFTWLFKKKEKLEVEKSELKFSRRLVFLFFVMSLSPFLFYGTSGIIGNLMTNLSARNSGYVAFSSGGLGSDNPIIVLLVQFIPATIILVGLSLPKLPKFHKIKALIPMLFLLFLYISLGSRGGTLFILLSLLIYFYIKRVNYNLPIVQVLIAGIVMYNILSFQINSREGSSIENRSSLTGYNLNKELAFIAANYGESRKFVDSDNEFESSILPIFETVVLFASNPIPRLVWNNKPFDKSFGDYNYLRLGSTGYEQGSNITPTVPGRYYMKYGLIGVFQIGFLLGIVWVLSNKMIMIYASGEPLKLLMAIAVSVTLFVCTRDLTAGKFYPVLILFVFSKLNNMLVRT